METRRISGRHIKILLVIAVITAVFAPVAVIAAGGTFTDDDDSIFESNIEWLASAGVTLGCNPPTNDNFCPTDNVTRGQMAAFMQRFAQYLGAEDGQVSNADDADTLMGESGSHYSNPAFGISCQTGNCPSGAALTLVEVLTLDVTAPEAGFLLLGNTYAANQAGASASYTQSWLTMDETDCGAWFGGPFAAVPGSWTVASVDGNVSFTSTSATTVAQVTAGNHTLRLCAIGIEAISTQQASLTALFTSEGGTTIVGALAPTPTDFAAFIDGYEGVTRINN